jgi:hypothetical protein
MNIGINPNAAAHAQTARGPQARNTATPPTAGGSDDGVEISLSQAAQQALKAGESEYTGNSPAHMARQYIAQSLAGTLAEGGDGPDLSGPFGQIVKTFAPGHNKETTEIGDAAPVDGGEAGDGTELPPVDETADSGETSDGTGGTGEVAEGTDGGDSTVVAGDPDVTGGSDDPPLIVEEPDITEILDEPAPAEDETADPESGVAGSGDDVASSGGDTSTDEGTPVLTSDPTTVAGTGDLTDELLDLLDEGTQETV